MAEYEDINYASWSTKEIFKELLVLRTGLDIAESEAKEARKEYDYFSMNIVPERMVDEGINNINVEGIGRISIRADMKVSTLSHLRVQLYGWLAEHGHSDLLTETINASTLKAFIREQMQEGNPIPDEFVSIHPYSRAVITKS